MRENWQAMLKAAWTKAGEPSYRELGRITGLNHETVRQTMNGNRAARRRTVKLLADALCGPVESSQIVIRWERDQGDDEPALEDATLPDSVEWIIVPDHLHGPVRDLLAAFQHDLHNIAGNAWVALPREENQK